MTRVGGRLSIARGAAIAVIACCAAVPSTAQAARATQWVKHVKIDGRDVAQIRHIDAPLFGHTSVNDFAGTDFSHGVISDPALQIAAQAGPGGSRSARLTTAPAPPLTWCGTSRTTDDVTDEISDGPRYKMVYAYPSGSPNHLANYANLIQQSATWIANSIAASAGNLRAPRFDYGLACNAQALDIITVQLSKTAAQYQAMAQADPEAFSDDLFNEIAAAVPAMHLAPGPWNYVAFADDVEDTAGTTRSVGTIDPDDQPGPANVNAQGGETALILGAGGADFDNGGADDPVYKDYFQYTVTHETGHTLGAVQDSAPHTTGSGHCTDGLGIMCYDDGGPHSGSYVGNVCADSEPPADPGFDSVTYAGIQFDCNDDDYLSPDPAPGSYLATHWNLFNSPFMCDTTVCTGREFEPSAHLLFSPPDPGPGQIETVSGVLSTDPDGNISTYAFDTEGDGTFAAASASPSTTFTVPSTLGSHSVGLTVTDSTRLSATTTTDYTVVDHPPVAAIGGPDTVTGGQTGTFDASSSSDPDPADGIVSYAWSTNDGQHGNQSTFAYTPATSAGGGHVVTLVVTDASGMHSSASKTVRVATPAVVTPIKQTGPGIGRVSKIKANHSGAVTVTMVCVSSGGHCTGTLKLRVGSHSRSVSYDIAPGATKALKIKRPSGVKVKHRVAATVVLRDSSNGKATTSPLHLTP